MDANEDGDKEVGVEMVLVPRTPTKEMIEAGWASAHDEDAVAVWEDMIEAWLASEQGKLVQR
jgi:hypothetical protein